MNDDHPVEREQAIANRRLSNRRLAGLILGLLALLFILWLGVKAWRIVKVARALPAYEQAFADLTSDGLTNADPQETEALVVALRADVVTVRREVQPFLPLASWFSWLPRIGLLLAEAQPLLDMADYGTEAGVYAVRGLMPALGALQQPEAGTSTVARVVPLLAAAQPDLERAATALDKVVAARAEIEDVDELPWRVRTLLTRLDEKLYLADILDLLVVAPGLLGYEEPRTYLLVAQNEDEVRATGGFISGAGLLTVDGGDVSNLDFMDANVVDAWGSGFSLVKPYDLAPEPLSQLMSVQLLLFRDANYWPDFPTSAAKMIELYRYGQESPQLDGVIAFDQRFMQLLLQNTGPLTIDDLEMTVTANNVINGLRQAWQADEEGESVGDWVRTRKDFLGPMATAIKEKLLSDFGSLDPLFFAENMYLALEEKHLQIYATDPQVAAVISANGWSNRVTAQSGTDFLFLVDSNVGFNKVGPYIASSIAYQLLIDESGRGEAVATATYTHTSQAEVVCRQGGAVSYAEMPDYEELIHDCFWNYLRLYVPEGSHLQEATRHSYPGDLFTFSEGWSADPQTTSELEGLALFQNFFLLAPGEMIESVYRYTLPQVTRPDGDREVYQLRLLRQPGVPPRPYRIAVTLPPGAAPYAVTPAPASQSGTTLLFTGDLVTDMSIRIVYNAP
ncbi:MAG: DUF4012 domain-containing protein [Anaerolineae bacterium]|nr:DUF4012 domain-containing protein [Anaerolineae bacterium]